jgi:hypothetical protein
MDTDMVKCPHCFGEKPAKARVCLHCGRDEQGFGPMAPPGQTAMIPGNLSIKKSITASDLRIHVVIGILIAAAGFLLMLTSGIGAVLFVAGIALLLSARLRIWWRGRL